MEKLLEELIFFNNKVVYMSLWYKKLIWSKSLWIWIQNIFLALPEIIFKLKLCNINTVWRIKSIFFPSVVMVNTLDTVSVWLKMLKAHMGLLSAWKDASPSVIHEVLISTNLTGHLECLVEQHYIKLFTHTTRSSSSNFDFDKKWGGVEEEHFMLTAEYSKLCVKKKKTHLNKFSRWNVLLLPNRGQSFIHSKQLGSAAW